jgi:hypothetical protein
VRRIPTLAFHPRRLARRLGHRAVLTTRGASERGDVPGWVLITVMTAALVVGLWTVAAPKLDELFTTAMSSVNLH